MSLKWGWSICNREFFFSAQVSLEKEARERQGESRTIRLLSTTGATSASVGAGEGDWPCWTIAWSPGLMKSVVHASLSLTFHPPLAVDLVSEKTEHTHILGDIFF